LVLFGRNLKGRLSVEESPRIKIVEGDFKDSAKLEEAMEGVDAVYLNAMDRPDSIRIIVDTMDKVGVKRFFGSTMAGVENEVPQKLSQWTKENLPEGYISGQIESTEIVKNSDLDYTIFRLTWLYNDSKKLDYELVPSGTEFKDAEISREAVVQGIMEVLTSDDQNKYSKKTFGLGEPNTHYDKPSFY